MLTYKQIQNAVYQWMIENVGIDDAAGKVRSDDINFTQPRTPFITYKLSTLRRVGQDYISAASAIGDVTISGDREFTCMITIVGDECIDIGNRLRDSLQKITVQERLNELGLVYFDDEPVQDISEDMNTGRQKRASLDVFFRLGNEALDRVGVVETVYVEAKLKDDNNDIVIDENVIINGLVD